MNEKKLTFEQRLRVYREAYRTFQIMAAKKAHSTEVDGMCEHLCRALNKLKYTWRRGYDLNVYSSRDFPEYHSYRPSRYYVHPMWGSTGYWWSVNTPRGREKRLEVLKALAEGRAKTDYK